MKRVVVSARAAGQPFTGGNGSDVSFWRACEMAGEGSTKELKKERKKAKKRMLALKKQAGLAKQKLEVDGVFCVRMSHPLRKIQ